MSLFMRFAAGEIERKRQKQRGDFVTSNEERAVLSKLIIRRH